MKSVIRWSCAGGAGTVAVGLVVVWEARGSAYCGTVRPREERAAKDWRRRFMRLARDDSGRVGRRSGDLGARPVLDRV